MKRASWYHLFFDLRYRIYLAFDDGYSKWGHRQYTFVAISSGASQQHTFSFCKEEEQ